MAKVIVRYQGVADVRRLTIDELKSVGVTVDHDLTWSRANKFRMVLDADDHFLDVLKAQGHFRIEAAADLGGAAETLILPTDLTSLGHTENWSTKKR
jgi:hypothetical protein